MNKSQLIDAIAADAKLTKADAKRALEAFVNATSQSLNKGERVALVGFGSFSTSKRAARQGLHPKAGTVINIPAKTVVRFKAGSELAGKVNK